MSRQEQSRTAAEAQRTELSAVVAQNAFYLVLGQVATTALAILLSAALGRLLGVNDFGLFYLITTMSTFAYVFVEWGQQLFVVREVVRAPSRSGEFLGTALVLRTALTIPLAILIGLLAWVLGYPVRTSLLAVFLVLASLPLFLAQAYGTVFRAFQKMGLEAAVLASNKGLVLCVAVPALLVGAGIPGVILAQGGAGFGALGIAALLYRRLAVTPPRFSLGAARELVSGGALILVMNAAISAQPFLDAVILSKLAPAAVVGWLGAARTILGTLVAPGTILSAAAYPNLARASADDSELRRELRSVLRPMLWLGALGGTGTYLFANTGIGIIYGSSQFGPAAMILKAFAPGFFLLFIDILLGAIIFASGRGTGFAVAKVASVMVATALDFLLIPHFQEHLGNGGVGVVVAFAVSELVVFAGAVIVLRRGTLEPAMGLDFARALGAAALTLLLFGFLPPISPGVGIPLCVVAFVAASSALGLLNRRDLAVVQVLVRFRRIDARQPAASEPLPGRRAIE
jgi:O-antigen/teichoic acid export membrane protein